MSGIGADLLEDWTGDGESTVADVERRKCKPLMTIITLSSLGVGLLVVTI